MLIKMNSWLRGTKKVVTKLVTKSKKDTFQMNEKCPETVGITTINVLRIVKLYELF